MARRTTSERAAGGPTGSSASTLRPTKVRERRDFRQPDEHLEPSAGVIIGRRRGLPGGRAVVGAFLIALAAVIVFALALTSAGSHGRSYVVVSRTLAAGTVIGPGDLATASLSLPSATAASAFRQSAALIGRTVTVTVTPGELIQSSMLGTAGAASGLRPVNVEVSTDSLSGLSAGDAVDVLASPTSSSASTSSSAPAPSVTVVFRGASLMAINHSSSGLLTSPTNDTLVTLGVANLSEVEAIVAAAQSGSITLVEAEPGDGVGPGPSSS